MIGKQKIKKKKGTLKKSGNKEIKNSLQDKRRWQRRAIVSIIGILDEEKQKQWNEQILITKKFS